MERADPEVFDDLAVDPRAQLPLVNGGQGAPRLSELTLRELLSQKQLEPLLHLASRLIREGDRQQLRWINAVLPDHVGNAVGQSSGLTAARTSHHQQWTFMVIHCLALGVIQAGQKTHEAACCCSSIASSRKLSERSFNSL